MPELPEVETIVRGLQPLVGYRITSVDTSASKGLIKSGTGEDFRYAVFDTQIKSIRRIGKWIRFDCQFFDGPFLLYTTSILSHLGMFGSWVKGGALGPHARLSLDLYGPQGSLRLTYNDMRSWGRLYAFTEAKANEFMKDRVGVDALELTLDHLTSKLRSYIGPVVEFLLDQSQVAGIGNIYRSEILHRSRIAPDRPATDLTPSEIQLLLTSIKIVLLASIEARGSSISDYVDSEGQPGYAHTFLTVYGRDQELCTLCKRSLVTISKKFDRTVFYCPSCQL